MIRCLKQVACAAALVCAGGVVLAQGTVMPIAASPKFAIKGFNVVGANPLEAGETAAVLAVFLRQDADIDTLQKATAALEAALKVKGFGLHRVVLPPQEVGETVKLEVVRFVVGSVEVSGNQYYGRENVLRSTSELQAGATPNFQRLATQTGIANESAGKQITVALKESAKPDHIDAVVQVRESKPWSVGVAASNAGSASSGNDRITLSLSHANVADRDHAVSASYTTSLEKPKNVKQYGLSYRIPLYEQLGALALSATRSDVVGNFGVFNSTGAGQTWGVSYTQYLLAREAYRGFVNVGVDDKLFDVTFINGIAVPGLVARRSRSLTVGYNARNETEASQWSYGLDFAHSLGGGAGNDLASYKTEDPRIDSAKWQALRGSAALSLPLTGRWVWSARSQFQYANRTLISGEQFGLGGQTSVRGTSDRPISGDRGVLLSTELSSGELVPGLRALGFVDAGALSNATANGTTKPDRDHLASLGLGLRYSGQGGMSVVADYARIITGSRVPLTLNSGSPQRGDDKLHLSISARF